MKHLYLAEGLLNPELFSKKIIIYDCGNAGKKNYNNETFSSNYIELKVMN